MFQELEDWQKWGVDGHFEARNPWYAYHEDLMAPAAKIVGALPHEVVHMNGLTTNLHLLMMSFYQPQGKRTKIICEYKAFPSDQYALETHLRARGIEPKENLIEVAPREGEELIHHEDIIAAINKCGDELALVMIGGVNYYTGQLFDLALITEAAHRVGAMAGFDLAHAAGNALLSLHDWQVDFAAWCTYKYLNSGPGSVSGIFVHERHGNNPNVPRFAGWWGYDKATRFEMKPGFVPMKGAEGWQLSNAPVFSMAVHRVALKQFEEAGMGALRAKSLNLTSYLQFVIEEVAKSTGRDLEVITPQDPEQRGCQLSLLAHGTGKKLFDDLTARGVVTDWREPNVIRMAPVPMYNSYRDIYEFGKRFEESLLQMG